MWEEIEGLLRKLPLTINRREEIVGRGAVFGVVVAKADHQVKIHSATFEYQAVLSRLFELLRSVNVL